MTQFDDSAGGAGTPEAPNAAPGKTLTDAARRALQEAAARRQAQAQISFPREINGRAGPEPVRYGDWEVKGIASDF